jgi:mycothiol system anti-sigma-R factor
MTCEEALKKLYEVIDNEASKIDKEAVEEHLKHCKACMARYEFEAMLKTFVCDKSTEPPVPEKTVGTDRLKQRILERIDDAEKGEPDFSARPFRMPAVIVAVAAAVVICVVAAFSALDYYRYQTYIKPFEDNYMEYAVDAIQVGAVDRPVSGVGACTPEVSEYIQNNLAMIINDSVAEFSLMGSGFAEIQGTKFVHLQLVHDGTPISLFIGCSKHVEMPGFEEEVALGNGYFKHICDYCQMMYWKDGTTMIVAVCENKAMNLAELRPVVQPL